MKDYDVVVVGAGLGGLSSACNLAKEGKRVLLLERHNVPGGYASSFTRGRFEFEISLHELSGLGDEHNRGPIWRLLEEYGVTKRVEFIPIPTSTAAVFPDLDITIPIGRANFERAVRALSGRAGGIMRFTDIVSNTPSRPCAPTAWGPRRDAGAGGVLHSHRQHE